MIILKCLLTMIALFVTLLFVTKTITDCVSAIYSNDFSDEDAQKDGVIRVYMIAIISILWPIIMFI
jgi:hypothetical protein